MAAVPITINYGETVHRDFLITGLVFAEDDKLLFVVRDRKETPLIWKTLTAEYNEALGGYVAPLDITHDESEKHLPKGSYKYGLTYYHNAVDNDKGFPVDGEVVVTIARKAFKVKEAVAREEGLQ